MRANLGSLELQFIQAAIIDCKRFLKARYGSKVITGAHKMLTGINGPIHTSCRKRRCQRVLVRLKDLASNPKGGGRFYLIKRSKNFGKYWQIDCQNLT